MTVIIVFSSSNDVIDIDTLDHEPPSYYDYEKLNEQFIDVNEAALPYDENWIDKIDRLTALFY